MTKTKDIPQAVQDEVTFDPLVAATEITVKNLNGDVSLNGTVPSYPQYLEAAAAARRVYGVTDVHNHLAVMLPPGDYRDGVSLTTAANNALTFDVTVPAGVTAFANDGNITLRGTVAVGSHLLAAARAVASLIGVRNVHNEINVQRPADPIDVSLRVQEALDRYSLIRDDSNVVVDTDDNTVTLMGHVRTWAEHDAVVNAAWMAEGVLEIRDDLSVTV